MQMYFHMHKLPFFCPRSISSAWWLYNTTPAMVQPLPEGVMVEEYALPDQPQLLFLQPSKSASKLAYLDDCQLFSYSKPAGLPPKHLARTQSLGMEVLVNLLPKDFRPVPRSNTQGLGQRKAIHLSFCRMWELLHSSSHHTPVIHWRSHSKHKQWN